LRLPDVSQSFILQTDASLIGIGAAFLQEDAAAEKLQWRLVAGNFNREKPDTPRSNGNIWPLYEA